jgi:hypothetical protein
MEASMKKHVLASALLAALLSAGSPAPAGVVDSPIPAPFTRHVFTVPGVVESGLGLDAFFSCTNLDSVAVTVGVELFLGIGGPAVNDATATSLAVAPGATVRFGTSPAVGLTVASVIGPVGLSSPGSARILATSTKIACTAFVADGSSAPPTSGWQLTIIAKTKQKAAN